MRLPSDERRRRRTTRCRTAPRLIPGFTGLVKVFGDTVRPGRSAAGVGFVPQLHAIEPDVPMPRTLSSPGSPGSPAPAVRSPGTKAERTRARRLLERLGVGHIARNPIGELSGGQQQRLLLARAMVPGNRLVLKDEPTSGVDLQTLAEILGLLRELHHDGVTVLLTTHDLNFVAAQLPRIVCLQHLVIADGAATAVLIHYVGRQHGVRPDAAIGIGDSVVA